MNLLHKTKTYLVGHMQYLSGRDWREDVTTSLKPLGITCFNPYKNLLLKMWKRMKPLGKKWKLG